MAMDVFLKLADVTGEAMDDHGHKDEIDVLAWSWGITQSGTTHAGSGSGGGKLNVHDISITKYVDNSTPTLMKFCANGKHIPDGKLTLRKAGENPLEYVTIELTDIIITSMSTGGSGGEDRLTENVSINFAEFKYVYTKQEADGTAGAAPEVTVNIPGNMVT
jgi:type VI secretion system secreted protein Hcp